jgi:hypothetical protein
MFSRHINKYSNRPGKVVGFPLKGEENQFLPPKINYVRPGYENTITCSNVRHDESIHPKESVPFNLFTNMDNEDIIYKSCLNCRNSDKARRQ